jgi:hypothetical protein
MSEKITKHKQYGFVYGVRTPTPLGRFAWINLIKPKESTFPLKEGETAPPPRYELTLLLDKADAKVAAWKEEVSAQIKEMVDLFNKGRPTKILVEDFLKDGDDVDIEKYPFYAGKYYLVPKHKDRPKIYDKDLTEILPNEVVGGMSGRLVVRPLCTAHGISFQLLTVQCGEDDGVRFAGSISEDKDLLSAISNDDNSEEQVVEVPAAAVVAAAPVKKATKGGLNLDKLA